MGGSCSSSSSTPSARPLASLASRTGSGYKYTSLSNAFRQKIEKAKQIT